MPATGPNGLVSLFMQINGPWQHNSHNGNQAYRLICLNVVIGLVYHESALGACYMDDRCSVFIYEKIRSRLSPFLQRPVGLQFDMFKCGFR